MFHKPLLTACALLALTAGCSSRPREFVASLSAPAPDPAAFDHDFALCRALVAQGHRSDFAAAAATSGAAVAASLGTVGAAGASGVIGPFMGATAGATFVAAVPIVGILAAWGVSRGIRSGRERRQNDAMTDCLAEHGHAVEGWTPARRSHRDPVGAAEPSAIEAQAGEAVAEEGSAL